MRENPRMLDKNVSMEEISRWHDELVQKESDLNEWYFQLQEQEEKLLKERQFVCAVSEQIMALLRQQQVQRKPQHRQFEKAIGERSHQYTLKKDTCQSKLSEKDEIERCKKEIRKWSERLRKRLAKKP